MDVIWQDFAWLRIANIIAAVGAMGVMGVSFSLRRSSTPRRYRRLAGCLYLLMGVVAYASGRAYSLHAPIAEHVLLMFVALVVLIAGILWHPEGDDALPGPSDSAIPARAWRAFKYYWIRMSEGSHVHFAERLARSSANQQTPIHLDRTRSRHKASPPKR